MESGSPMLPALSEDGLAENRYSKGSVAHVVMRGNHPNNIFSNIYLPNQGLGMVQIWYTEHKKNVNTIVQYSPSWKTAIIRPHVFNTVKPALKDYSYQRTSVLKDHSILSQISTTQLF